MEEMSTLINLNKHNLELFIANDRRFFAEKKKATNGFSFSKKLICSLIIKWWQINFTTKLEA